MNSETVDDQCINDNLHDLLPPSVEEIENEMRVRILIEKVRDLGELLLRFEITLQKLV